jgi:hypothetical protein
MHIGYWWESQKVGKRPLGRPRYIKMGLGETGWDGREEAGLP